uniref:Uncharacterized protein n=1 Tax=Anopheles albimanus TaxID=7167 RepID=A0A182F788_ANOAL
MQDRHCLKRASAFVDGRSTSGGTMVERIVEENCDGTSAVVRSQQHFLYLLPLGITARDCYDDGAGMARQITVGRQMRSVDPGIGSIVSRCTGNRRQQDILVPLEKDILGRPRQEENCVSVRT